MNRLLSLFGTVAGAITGFYGAHILTGLIMGYGVPLLAAAGASVAAALIAGLLINNILDRYGGFFSNFGGGLLIGALASAAMDINLFGLFSQNPSPTWWTRPIGPS